MSGEDSGECGTEHFGGFLAKVAGIRSVLAAVLEEKGLNVRNWDFAVAALMVAVPARRCLVA